MPLALYALTVGAFGNGVKEFVINGQLIEVGAGFHPDLTGRENVFLNGVILGMSRAEIDTKMKAIIDSSVVIKWFVKEDGADESLDLRFQPLAAPGRQDVHIQTVPLPGVVDGAVRPDRDSRRLVHH